MKRKEKLKVMHQQLYDKWFVRKREIFTFCEKERKKKLKVLHQQLQDKWFVKKREIFTFCEETKSAASTASR